MSEATRRTPIAPAALPAFTPEYRPAAQNPAHAKGDERRGRARPKIGPGSRVGRLTVVEATRRRRGRYTVWRCACECGGEIELDTRYLQRGTVTDCGCAGGVGPDEREERERRSGRRRLGPGYRVGRLTVAEATQERRGSHTVWRCECECGGEILLDTRQLRRGAVTSCGCEQRGSGRIRDLSGQRFGKLTALSYTGESSRNGAIWLCRCDCGGQARVPRGQLVNGYVKSCGCLSHPPLKDFIGRRFGRLEVTGYAGKRNGQHMWDCRCECGRTTRVRQTYLQSGRTQSCGCLQAEAYRENLKLAGGTAVALLERYQERLSASNRSGHNGVYKSRRTGKWSAQITFRGKTKYLGSYAKIEDAVRARWIAQQEVEQFLERYYAEHPEKRPEQAESGKGGNGSEADENACGEAERGAGGDSAAAVHGAEAAGGVDDRGERAGRNRMGEQRRAAARAGAGGDRRNALP